MCCLYFSEKGDVTIYDGELQVRGFFYITIFYYFKVQILSASYVVTVS